MDVSSPKTVEKKAKKLSEPVIPAHNKIIFIMLVSCFVVWGMLNNMNDTLVPAFGKIFMMNAVNSSIIQVAFYSAYALLAIPAALIIKKWSYRTGVLIGLGLFIIGALGYIPASIVQNYNIFVVSIFILASGLSMLETTCNPFVLSLGSEETSVRRLNYAQAFNPVGSFMGLIVAKFVILGNLNSATYEDRIKMSVDKLAEIRHTELIWLCMPYMVLIIIAAFIWSAFFKNKSAIKDVGGAVNFKKSVKSLLSTKRYVYGVIAQFFYVGMQVAVWTWMTKYTMILLGVNEAKAVEPFIIATVLFIAMRWICTGLMKKFMPARMMAVMAIAGIIFTLGAIYLPAGLSIICLIAISGCMSLMFPTIYGIALGGLGEESKLGAAGLIMAILGGAVFPTFMGKLIDLGTLSALTPMYSGVEAAVRSCYFAPIVCLVIILAYSIMNSKSRT
ncbi:L-fucose:H+ symporter permease [Clostridium sp. SHJSY1]|uniref:L-fucose:H+ symporter permease n=1 Tax=Clostridium sp. SHJSY1 TaxID=2942483 RepID=UPI002875FA81|nr:L-fucose:H+ symporter permease [Clostridium sp. SHJSY1]MDS0525956.1 L-fucose:H+ symporter permease [Clostridium sp. SHJSY1]